MQTKNSGGIVHINSNEGHRFSYLDLLSNVLHLNKSIGSIRNILTLHKLIFTKKLLLASLDDDVFGFVIIALIRALFFHNTVALFIRPQSCFHNNIKSQIKYFIFRILSLIKFVRVITIIQNFDGNDYSKISKDWVHDPQMWDIFDSPRIESLSFSEALLKNAENRKIISLIGRVSNDKGIESLINLINDHGNICASYYFIVAGKFDNDAIESFKSIKSKNIKLINRHLSDDEIGSLYCISTLIWCCYNKNYDQASGIFGRAAQLGKIAVVRKGSSIEMIAKHYQIPVFAIDPLSLEEAAKSLDNIMWEINTYPDLSLFAQWRDNFICKVIGSF
jgi:hypothetical protein